MKRYMLFSLCLMCVQVSASGFDNLMLINSPPILNISSSSANNGTTTMCFKNKKNDIVNASTCAANARCTQQIVDTLVTITNTGGKSAPLSTTLMVAGNDPTYAQLINNNCRGISLAKDQTCTVTVRIDPCNPGIVATLTVSSDNSDPVIITITAVAP